MQWDRDLWDQQILKKIRELADLRRTHEELLTGNTTFLNINDALGWLRWVDESPDAILVLANPDTERSLNIDINRILKVSHLQAWGPECQVWPEHRIYEKPSVLKIILHSLEVKWIHLKRKKGR